MISVIESLIGYRRQQYFIGNVLLVLIVVFQIITGGKMLSASNLHNLLAGNAHIFILTIGMVLVVLIGQIDLSVGALAAFVSMTVALAISSLGIPWWLGILGGLVMGALIGALQASFLAWAAIPSFVVTLAGMLVFRGLLQWESQAVSVPLPPQYHALGAGTLPDIGRFLGIDFATILLGLLIAALLIWDQFRRYEEAKLHAVEAPMFILLGRAAMILLATAGMVYLFGRGPSGTTLPLSALMVLALTLVYHLITRRTAFGRHVYAVGGNPAAAHLSGVSLARVQFFVMTNMGLLAALAGMVFAARATAAGPQDGILWELDVIAAVFIGGVAIYGGQGSVVGGVLGALVIAVLNNGLLLLGVGSDRAQIIRGVVLVVAVVFSMWSRGHQKLSAAERVMRSRAFHV